MNLRKRLAKMSYIKGGIKEAVRFLRREPPITSGEFNLTELPALLGKDNPIILDIGCNDGSHTRGFLKLFKNSKVYAFEPDPRAQDRFRYNVQDDRANLFSLAISDTNGEIDFHMSNGTPSPDWEEKLPKGWDLSGSIRNPKKHLDVHPWCTFDESIKVQSKTLDTWRDEQGIEVIDLIWADVQGAEVDLIKGGKKALCKTRFFYTEYCNQELYEGQISLRKILNLLPDFKVLYRFSSDVLLKNKRWD